MAHFHNQIRAAIANSTLQEALDANAARRIQARERAFQGLPEDFPTLQKRVRQIRQEVIHNLESYLEQFSDNARKNGFILHRAATAAEACTIILDIVHQRRAKLIVKAKSMVSEEIQLNPALEAAGLQVVETDLGEYIVQLRGEHPSHIITPAVHLRREDVGETFHRKLGVPLTDDIPTLTNIARSKLRQYFLDADIGISGVNMGVAETGAICIVTNEGNGRMVTTLPPVHIALMGIERLLPDARSLATVLRVLPRSATGQKITVYTQLICGPRRPGEPDGAKERHLILIDNGRSNLRRSPLADILFCIRCGACINACPVFREIGGFAYTGKRGEYTPYPGPMGSVLSAGLFGQEQFGHLAQASTLCGACMEACPAGIDLPSLLLRVRAGGTELEQKTQENAIPEGLTRPLAWSLRGFTWLTTHPRLFSAIQKLGSWMGGLVSPRHSWIRPPAFTGWGYSRDLPKPARKTFRQRWDAVAKTPNIPPGPMQSPETKPSPKAARDNTPSAEHLIERFHREFTDLNGVFVPCPSDMLAGKIVALLKEKGITQVMAWENSQLPAGLVSELERKGIRVIVGSDSTIKAGITAVKAAIAETGTLVLTSGTGRPLSTSLLPEIHIAVLHQEDIYENIAQVLGLQEVWEPSSTVLISGPSRTADIEMTLTIGVHGPGEVYVFCVP